MYFIMDNLYFDQDANQSLAGEQIFRNPWVTDCFIDRVPKVEQSVKVFRDVDCIVEGRNFTISDLSDFYYFSGPAKDQGYEKYLGNIETLVSPAFVVGNSAYLIHYHFIYQTWLPAFYLKHTFGHLSSYVLLGPPLRKPLFKEAMEILDLKYIELEPTEVYRVNSATFTDLNLEGWSPQNPQKKVFDLIEDKIIVDDLDTPKKVYISRQDSLGRRIVNENDVIKTVNDFGYTSVILENLSFKDQIALFRNATHIIAPHGSGLVNLIFCRDGITVIELMPDFYINHCFFVIGKCKNMTYSVVINKGIGPRPISSADYATINTNTVYVDVVNLGKIITTHAGI